MTHPPSEPARWPEQELRDLARVLGYDDLWEHVKTVERALQAHADEQAASLAKVADLRGALGQMRERVLAAMEGQTRWVSVQAIRPALDDPSPESPDV